MEHIQYLEETVGQEQRLVVSRKPQRQLYHLWSVGPRHKEVSHGK